MQVARAEEGGEALGVLTVDAEVPANVLADIAAEIGAVSARTVSLT